MSDITSPPLTGPSFEARIRQVLGFLLGGMLLVAAGGVLSAWALADAADDVDRVERAGAALAEVAEGMVDQETGVRGFVLTGREPFLETYGPGGANADRGLAVLLESTRDIDGFDDFGVDDLGDAITSWRVIADEEISLVRSGRQDDAAAIVESGVAKQRFDIVRTYVGDIEDRLGDIIDGRNRRQAVLGRLVAIAGVAVFLGAVVVIVALLRWLRRSVTRPLAALTGAVADADSRPFRAVTGDAAGEVAAIALSTDRLRTAKDIERNEAVILAEQSERTRVAADLHDGPVQTLFALQLRLQHALQRPHDEAAAANVFAGVIDVLERTQSGLRSLMFDLAPPGIGERPLSVVLADVVAETIEPPLRSHVVVPDDIALSKATQLVICRVVVEAIRNASRHAGATDITVCARSGSHGVTVAISDDGVGFDVVDVPGVGHFGLDIMRSLVESIGGTFEVWSMRGAGTCIRVVAPSASGFIEVDQPVSHGHHDSFEL